MILVDTSVWVDWSNHKASDVALELDRLLQADEVVTTDVVMTEVLQGARTEAIFENWMSMLDALHYLPVTHATWLSAASVAFRLMRQGQATALSDLLIAQVALDNDLAVFTTDTDFRRVPNLMIHDYP